ncbi:MAG: MBL fold metallo-hydrolase [Bacillota bacterium]|nr:MBL fold metallo-hydrolase [Bacillota bacterium]
MEITWLGHSSFLIKNKAGTTILTDPFNDSVGYSVFNGYADIVTISHHHFDHSCAEAVLGNPEIIDAVGIFDIKDVQIVGLPSYHDKMEGALRGKNTIYIYKIDDYRVCHLGDLGHFLSEDDLDKIGAVDILFIPVGGNFTIDGAEASEIAKKINSHLIIPMHYKTAALNFPLEGVESFITYMKNGERINSCTLEITEKLEDTNLVKILDYKN